MVVEVTFFVGFAVGFLVGFFVGASAEIKCKIIKLHFNEVQALQKCCFVKNSLIPCGFCVVFLVAGLFVVVEAFVTGFFVVGGVPGLPVFAGLEGGFVVARVGFTVGLVVCLNGFVVDTLVGALVGFATFTGFLVVGMVSFCFKWLMSYSAALTFFLSYTMSTRLSKFP